MEQNEQGLREALQNSLLLTELADPSGSSTSPTRRVPHLRLVEPEATPSEPAGEADLARGHRERLRQRLLDGGPEALLDHELVEYLLALAIPRRDTKPLAKRLIRRFGNYAALVSADPQALVRAGLSEATVAALKLSQAAALRLLKAPLHQRPVLGSWQALLDYLRADMAHQPIERVRLLFLNSKNMLIRDEAMWEGSVDESAVHIREIVKRALDCQATALIIVHNHPSGDPTPSQQDIRLTRDLVEACRHLKIAVHDHVIVGASGHSSLRAMGLL